jgi:hypothetical protein
MQDEFAHDLFALDLSLSAVKVLSMPLSLTKADRDAIFWAYAEAVRQRKEITDCYLAARDVLRELRPELSTQRAAAVTIVMGRLRHC